MEDLEPEFLICKECETPCYDFEYKNGKILRAFCTVCGCEEVDDFKVPNE